jgi:pimeloyl-ACP methyl ester carboxylesterase
LNVSIGSPRASGEKSHLAPLGAKGVAAARADRTEDIMSSDQGGQAKGAAPAMPRIGEAWAGVWSVGLAGHAIEYWVDAAQRATLFWDVMRQRGNQYLEQMQKETPHVLSFESELIVDGRKLQRPTNYGMVRIVAPHGMRAEPRRRPFVIVDPRAGHGPGIGGFKADSEIGVAMAAGHPCYFIGFTPTPEPGQTIEAVLQAMATFLEKVNALHPNAEGRPAVVANCQAGWAIMMAAAVRPELFGPVIVAGSPLSYWAGVRDANPMRYSGGLLGGSWLAALTSDVGNGTFDGAWLVQNFENLNPANTLWTKQYNLYANIDTEGPRYLGFEKWWGGHVLMTGEEMQAIVDKLFVGNKLGSAELTTTDGVRVDLRNVQGPIVVLCSKGDDITPPQQALGWILDLYDSVDDIRSHGQTIVYAVHETIGHLGIFVSGSVARKEHSEFASNIDLIDCLPPGLYEAVLTRKSADDPGATDVGEYVARFEARTLDDIRALGGNTEEDERCFATVARLSEVNLGLYRTFLSPWIRACSSEAAAETMRRLHPLRLQYELFSDRNPLSHGVAQAAAAVRNDRRPVSAGNPFLAWERRLSEQITSALETYGALRDQMAEQIFLGIYGTPAVQALAGLAASDGPVRRRPGRELEHTAFVAKRIDGLKSRAATGGAREAAIRALLYIGLPEGVVDERGFAVVQKMREEHGEGLSLAQFKTLVREQFLTLLLEPERAVQAIPAMAARNGAAGRNILPAIRRVIAARGPLGLEGRERLERIEMMLTEAPLPAEAKNAPVMAKSPFAKRPASAAKAKDTVPAS